MHYALCRSLPRRRSGRAGVSRPGALPPPLAGCRRLARCYGRCEADMRLLSATERALLTRRTAQARGEPIAVGRVERTALAQARRAMGWRAFAPSLSLLLTTRPPRFLTRVASTAPTAPSLALSTSPAPSLAPPPPPFPPPRRRPTCAFSRSPSAASPRSPPTPSCSTSPPTSRPSRTPSPRPTTTSSSEEEPVRPLELTRLPLPGQPQLTPTPPCSRSRGRFSSRRRQLEQHDSRPRGGRQRPGRPSYRHPGLRRCVSSSRSFSFSSAFTR